MVPTARLVLGFLSFGIFFVVQRECKHLAVPLLGLLKSQWVFQEIPVLGRMASY